MHAAAEAVSCEAPVSKPIITLVMKDYDYIAPLACGDVEVEGVSLKLDRDTPRALDRTLADASIDAGELSFSRHVLRLAAGDCSIVGLPFFAYRGFRHRCFFVLRGSGLHDLRQLEGKRVGTNEWPASGNVWSRALLREQGVAISDIRWWVAPVDNPKTARRPQGDLPPYVQLAPLDRSLRDMLLDGELDALMCPLPPSGFYDVASPIVRLYPDYRRVEQDYYRRVGVYSPHHIIGIRREAFERNPWVARSVFNALDQSRLLWQERRRAWAEPTPWYQAELEEITALMGHDWQINGVEPNRKAIQAFCDELFAQGLIAHPLDGAAVFSEFEEVMKYQPA